MPNDTGCPLKTKVYATFIFAIIVASLVIVGLIPLLNGALLAPFALGLFLLSGPISNRALLALALCLTVVLGFFIAIYRPGGFSYPLVWRTDSLYPGGDKWILYANLSKGLGGYLVLLWLGHIHHKEPPNLGRNVFPSIKDWLLAICAALFILGVGYLFFGISWQPKMVSGLLPFILVNLFVTVLAEEAFFRLLLQDQIMRFSRGILGILASVAIVSLLFAFSHSGAIGSAFFLYLTAGTLYALVYTATRRLTVSIGTHFGVNIAHFIFLEYPL